MEYLRNDLGIRAYMKLRKHWWGECQGVTLEGQESFCWKVREADSEDLQGSQKLTGKLLQLSSLFENASVMCLGLGCNNGSK